MSQYNNVKNIAEAELAGCLDIVVDPNNFDLVRDNLTMRIACYLRHSSDAYAMQNQINEEAETVLLPEYEYVINELQYEFRVATTLGYKKMDMPKETDIINKWAKLLIKRFGIDAALDFINTLKANRAKRTRTFEIIW